MKANLIQTLNMCKSMSLNKQSVSLVLLTDLSKKESEKAINSIIDDYSRFFQINFISYKTKINFFSEFQRFKVLKKHIDFSADILFTRSPLVALFSTLNKKNVIYESHNAYFTKQITLNIIYKTLFKLLFKSKYLKLFISISDNLNNFWLEKGLPEEKSLSAHDGTEIMNFNKTIHLDIPFKNSDKLLVTYTGSLYIDRGLDRIIQLAKDFENLNFLVVGGPAENAEEFRMQCQKESINNIHFTGPVPHFKIASYLNASDVLLALWSKKVTTINYCSPLKVFEYMASNKLIIADGFITIKEVLSHKKNSLLVTPDDYSSLKAELMNVSNDLSLLNLGLNNSNLIEEKYSWKKRCQLIIEKL